MEQFEKDEINLCPKEAIAAVASAEEAKDCSLDESYDENRETKKRKHENRSNCFDSSPAMNNQKLSNDFTNCNAEHFEPVVTDYVENAKPVEPFDEKNEKSIDDCVVAGNNPTLPVDVLEEAKSSSGYRQPSVERILENIGRSLDENDDAVEPKRKLKFRRSSPQQTVDAASETAPRSSRLSSTPDDDDRAVAQQPVDDWIDEPGRIGPFSARMLDINTYTPIQRSDDDDSDADDAKNGDAEAAAELVGRHEWFSHRAIRYREYGQSNVKSPEWFRYNAIGSLHMVQRLELMYKMENHEGCVNCLHFNGSGTRLASGSDDLNVCIWNWAESKALITFPTGHRQNVFQAKFMPLSGDCHIVTCARDGQVRLAELSVQGVCKGTRKLAQHKGAAHKLTLELDSPHVFLTCGEDGVVFELDLRDPKPNKLLTCKEPSDRDKTVPLYSIHSHPKNPYYFAVCGCDQFSRIYDKRYISDANAVKKFCPAHLVAANSKANITCLVFNHDGSELLASYNDDDIFLFDVNCTSDKFGTDHVIHRYTGHRNNATVKGVNFYGPNSEFVVTGSDCGYIYFWERKTEKIVQFLQGDEQGVINVLEPHPTAAFLATSGLDHDIKIWVPSNENPTFDKNRLKKLTVRNAKDREADRRAENDNIDSHMLFLLLSRMRRNQRRVSLFNSLGLSDKNKERRSQSGQQGEESNNEAEDASGEPSEESDQPSDSGDDDADGQSALQCRTS